MSNQFTKYTTLLYIVGVLFIIWGVLGAMDAKNYTNRGYQTDDNYKIIKIEEDSPAEKAGLQVGDIVKSTGGIAVTDTKSLKQRQRPEIGETREIVVDRNGDETSLQLTYEGMSAKDGTLNRVGNFIGLLFILLGLFAHRKHKTALSFSFAVFAVCFGFLFTNGPYISAVLLSTIISIISNFIFLFSFTYLVIYMLKFPPESAFLGTAKNRKLIYAPMVLLMAIIIVLEVLQVDGSGTLNMVMRLLFGAFIICYFGIALITLIRKYMKASAADRQSKGLNMMLIGAVVGLLPILIYFTINTISPGMDLPGNDYIFITFIAIPIFFSLALNQVYKSAEV